MSTSLTHLLTEIRGDERSTELFAAVIDAAKSDVR